MLDGRHAFRPLLQMQWRALRGQRLAITLATLALPLGIITALSDSPLQAALLQRTEIVALSPVLPMLGMAFLVMPPFLARMREQRQILFYATLPIGRLVFLRALLASFTLAALPGIVLAPLLALSLLQVKATFLVGYLLGIVLIGLPLAALGAALGLSGLRQTAATAWGMAAYVVSVGALVLLAASPHLPNTLYNLAFMLPASRGSDLLAAFLPFDGQRQVAGDLLALILYAAGAGFLAYRLLPWRREQPTELPSPLAQALSHLPQIVPQPADGNESGGN